MPHVKVVNRFVKGLWVVVGVAMVAGTVSYAAGARIIRMEDQCDPETFNAVFGDGTCVSSHRGVTFEHFINELMHTQRAGGWMFSPRQVNVTEDQSFQAQNNGGEVHTFTEVDDFGGGIIPELNALAGTPDIAPACAALEDDDFVPPGGTYREDADEAGTVKFQCCIHPWMRLTAKVK